MRGSPWMSATRVGAGDVGGPHHTRVIDQLGGRELRLRVETTRRQMGEVCLADRIEEQLSRGRDTAAEHEHLRVEDRAQGGCRLTEPSAELPQREERARVLRDDEVVDEVAVELAMLRPGRRESLPD